jgi:hypothetical protein
MSKQQDTENELAKGVLSKAIGDGFTLKIDNLTVGINQVQKIVSLVPSSKYIDQQKAEAADQAVREFAAELKGNLNWIHINSPQAALNVLKDTLEQFLGKGKDK